MQLDKTSKSPTLVELKITAGASDLEPIRRHVLGHFARQVKIPGFRVGKAPLNLIEQRVDQKAFANEFMEHTLNDLYRKALSQENIRPVGQPKVTLKKFVPYSNMEFDVEVETFGPIILPDYKQIKLPKPKTAVVAKNVDEVVSSLQERQAERQTVDRPAKIGDEAVVDFSGKNKEGQPVAGAAGQDHPLILGSNTFIPGFEDHLIGLKAGESKEFAITFPKDYRVTSLQDQKVSFRVDIKKISELTKPKIDDRFASKVGPFKTLSELKADIKKQLALERQRQVDVEHENELIRTITSRSRVEVPEGLIDEQILSMEEEEKRNLAYQGQTWQEHLEAEGVTEQQHRERQRPQAEERVKGGLVLSEIANKERVEVTPEELEIRLQILKGQYKDPAMQAELNKPENRQDIATRLLTEKTIDKLVEFASK